MRTGSSESGTGGSGLAGLSPELRRAVEDLDAALEDAGPGNPVGAVRAVRRVAARHRDLPPAGRDAFRHIVERRLGPVFQGPPAVSVTKVCAWVALDSAWSRV